MVGGHPYLVRLALYYLVRKEMTLQQILQQAATEAGIYSDHLRRILAILKTDPALEAAFKQVISLENPTRLLSTIVYELDSIGLITVNGDLVNYSCELYRLYFKNQLL